MLSFDRKQQNSVKQLPFNKRINTFFKKRKKKRMRDTVRTVSQLKGEPTLNSPLLYPGYKYKEWDRCLVGHLLIE